MLGRKPLFPGTSTIHQLGKIFNILGLPSPRYVTEMLKPAARKWVQRQKPRRVIPFSELYPQANALALNLLENLLRVDPQDRLSASDALKHPYITSLGLPLDTNVDTFVGVLDVAHEDVAGTKTAMQEAMFEQVCYFHPDARAADGVKRD